MLLAHSADCAPCFSVALDWKLKEDSTSQKIDRIFGVTVEVRPRLKTWSHDTVDQRTMSEDGQVKRRAVERDELRREFCDPTWSERTPRARMLPKVIGSIAWSKRAISALLASSASSTARPSCVSASSSLASRSIRP
jgi:hypothetical protein